MTNEQQKKRAAGNAGTQIRNLFGHMTGSVMTLYILFYLCIFPLLLHDKYYDILAFRFKLFWIPTLVVSICFLIMGMVYLLADKIYNGGALFRELREQLHLVQLRKQLTATDRWFFVLILLMGISVLLADYQYEALWGSLGRSNGLVLWLMFFAAYIMVTRFYHFRRGHLYAYLFAACLPELWGITDFFELNLFGLLNDVNEQYRYTFVSSVGNINTYTNMVSLHLAASVSLFVVSDDRREQLLSGIAMIISAFAIIMGISDNAILAAAALFAFLPLAAWRSGGQLLRYFIALSAFASAVLLSGLSALGRETIANWGGGSVLISLGQTAAFGGICLLLWLFMLGLYVFLRRKQKMEDVGASPASAPEEERTLRRLRRGWLFLLIVSILLVIAVLIDANSGRHAALWAPLENLLVFNDSWGTGRGLNWRLAMEYFTGDAGLLKQLIGYGPDTYYIITMDRYKNLMREAGYGIFDAAHNEYIDYITTIGILGTLAYLGTFISGIRKLLRKPVNPYAAACAFSVIAYGAQAFVNISVPITTPILMLLFYMGISSRKDF